MGLMRVRETGLLLFAVALSTLACSGGSEPAAQGTGQLSPVEGSGDGDGTDGDGTDGAPGEGDVASAPAPPDAPIVAVPDEQPVTRLVEPAAPAEPGDVVDVVCVAQSAAGELRRVYMAFAFDISASMGTDLQRFTRKWQPVVAATKSFFAEEEAAGISASLTFFPSAGSDAMQCSAGSYTTPNVAQTFLPSPVFAEAIDGLALTPDGNWLTSTPTLAVYDGTVASLRAIQQSEADANATYAIVLVTDGLPQSCGADDDLARVLDAVRGSGILTYVVGVELEQNTAANLDQLAEAGGTDSAFIIETADPTQTERDFKTAVDEIRGVTLSCEVQIPLPPVNTKFIPEQVNVTYDAGGELQRLSYDASCASADAWRYDDPTNPSVIVLCNDACGIVQQNLRAKLEIEFGCRRQDVPR
jgi:von Willebrand factor type A domain-containing protein